ncbi:MAG: class I SAM-dependent methyltransferase [Bryobacteraceae bacterium]
MEIHYDRLGDVDRYLQMHGRLRLEEKQPAFENILRYIRKVRAVTPSCRILEVGTGVGWFPLLCGLNGLSCKGLEISPQLIEYARELGRSYGVEADLTLGNLETVDLGEAQYDVIVCSSVFEHVERWRESLGRVYRALKIGGALFFESTNKFSLTSGEWPSFPLYGWLPNGVRYRLRKLAHGPDIMKLGIDFHQFTYPLLRRAFRQAGFSRILDRVELSDPDLVASPVKRLTLKVCRSFPPARHLVLTFFEATTFVCVK